MEKTLILSCHGTLTGNWLSLPENVTIRFTTRGGLLAFADYDKVVFSKRRCDKFMLAHPDAIVSYTQPTEIIPDLKLNFSDKKLLSGIYDRKVVDEKLALKTLDAIIDDSEPDPAALANFRDHYGYRMGTTGKIAISQVHTRENT